MQSVKAGFGLVRFRWKDTQSQPAEKDRGNVFIFRVESCFLVAKQNFWVSGQKLRGALN